MLKHTKKLKLVTGSNYLYGSIKKETGIRKSLSASWLLSGVQFKDKNGENPITMTTDIFVLCYWYHDLIYNPQKETHWQNTYMKHSNYKHTTHTPTYKHTVTNRAFQTRFIQYCQNQTYFFTPLIIFRWRNSAIFILCLITNRELCTYRGCI